MDEKQFNSYDTGTDFWRDNVASYGIDEAVIVSGRYLDMQLKSEVSDIEKKFCREIFAAMHEATADKLVPSKIVYPYDFNVAGDRAETSYFHKNQDMNKECAHTIDAAISTSNYKTNYYNLEIAAMSVIRKHGFQRVNTVLAYQIQNHESDGRYSGTNKKWAKGFKLTDKTYTFLSSHAILVEDFTTYARKLYTELGADRFALLGTEEHGESEPVHGYEIIKSIMVDDKQGYAIAHNPNAVDPYVCWQFMIRDGERHYNWGLYGGYEYAVDGYNARLFIGLN